MPSSAALENGDSVPVSRPGPYNKLMGRFYEPLFLLKALGQTRGKHTAVSSDIDDAGLSRRRLLDNLAYLCDLRKGGETTCAVAVEDRPECYNFWLAANSSRVLPEMRNSFVEVLEDIRRIIFCLEDEKQTRVEALTLRCIRFSIKRVWAEKTRLYKSIDECKGKMKSSTSSDDTLLVQWLSRFRDLDCEELCFLAYQERNSNDMKGLERRFNPDNDSHIYQPHLELYRKLRHRLGRLANHVRAVQQVINDAHDFSFLFSEGGSHVICLPPIPSAPAPQADALLTPPGILKRMGLKGSKLKEYSTAMASMDQRLQLIKNMREEYAKPNLQPRVHAEIQILEQFHMAELQFFAGDRYIGCSKPACLCCLLYFKAHSAEPADPRSHLKIWPNWGPPYLAGEAKDPKFTEQRIVLTKMLVAIRKEAIEQIRRKGPPPAWQNDSTSAFTRRLAQDAPDKLQGHFERLSIEDSDLLDLDSFGSDTDESGLLKGANSSSDVRSQASVANMDGSDTDSFSDQVSKAEEDEESDTEGGAKL